MIEVIHGAGRGMAPQLGDQASQCSNCAVTAGLRSNCM